MKPLDYLLLALLAIWFAWAVGRIVRQRRQGGCCGCSGCAPVKKAHAPCERCAGDCAHCREKR